ncbi:hypothetical protein RM531_08135 [Salinisphaera sp. P385]|uniref:Uncharacterized protein n=1 Tax=Spectribacter acetivorans TaxID=3075603 RepID=A0ABU3B7J6_9GAMM|nr:hypothetical protein [Salinisphaera sp. P385]MDT0618443.1 hypothetical protein [Salinisphaera sp. P385]
MSSPGAIVGLIEALRARSPDTDPECHEAADALARMHALLHTPELIDFREAVLRETAHQRERWPGGHDENKSADEWLWLIAHLATKASQAARYGDQDKCQHHIITTAAACANWHAAVTPAGNANDGRQCECHHCIEAKGLTGDGGLPLSACQMIVCSDCGNKRCPKAEDHRFACTGSNETGQIGQREGRASLPSLIKHPVFPVGAVVVHRKGMRYQIIGGPDVYRLEATGEPAYLYRAVEGGEIWVRCAADMEDGRFSLSGMGN